MSEPADDHARRERGVQQLFDDLPEPHDARYRALQDLSRAFHEALARAYEPSYNQYLSGLPSDLLTDKQSLATTANRLARELKLSIRLPGGEDLPSILTADRGGRGTASRFRFQARTSAAKQRFGWHAQLPHLELMPSPVRDENFTRYADRVRSGALKSDEPER